MSKLIMPLDEIWFDKPTDVSFQDEGKYFFLTNFEESYPFSTPYLPTEIDSRGNIVPTSGFIHPRRGSQFTWKTSEHLFHALKFTQKGGRIDLIEGIEDQLSPQQALNFARNHNSDYEVKNWWFGGNYGVAGYNVNAMKWVVKKKFKNPTLKQKLLVTGNKKLVENTSTRRREDKFWGTGYLNSDGSWNGQNWLGKILMELRVELKNSEDQEVDTNELASLVNWISEQLQRSGLQTSNLPSQYQNWQNFIPTIRKVSVFNKYSDAIKAEIHKAMQLKTKKASSDYRRRLVNELEKKVKEYDCGEFQARIDEELEIIEGRISNEWETEEELSGLSDWFLNAVKVISKEKNQNKKTPAELLEKLKKLNQKNQEEIADLLKQEESLPINFNSIKQYFEANKISSITLNNEDLIVKYNNNQPSQNLSLLIDHELRQVKKFLIKNNRSLLSYQQIKDMTTKSKQSQQPQSNYWPWIVGGGVVISLVFLVVLLTSFKRRIVRA